MAHHKERKERVCLNCNARTFGPYCQVCGQHNVEPRESVGDLLVHFINDITHFEGKFITTLRYLMLKPGWLTKEYIRGRRVSYMNPVRMYVFTSAVFFVLFFFLYEPKKLLQTSNLSASLPNELVLQVKDSLLAQAQNRQDSLKIDSIFEKWPPATRLLQSGIDSSGGNNNAKDALDIDLGKAEAYQTVADYEKEQTHLPDSVKDGWLKHIVMRKTIALNQRYKYRKHELLADVMSNFLHSFPKLLFISLPLFALILYGLYYKKSKYYTEHLIFSIHYFVFAFIWLMVLFAVKYVDDVLPWKGWAFVQKVWWLLFFIYLYKALRNFYQQSRLRTLLKLSMLIVFAFILNLILFFLFFSYSLLLV